MSNAMLARLAAVGADLRDDEQTRQNKGLLLLITILVLPIGVVWGCLYLIFGSWVGYVPLVYALILLSAIVAFIRTRSLALLLRVNLIAILFAPTLSMIPLGGFLPSGAVGMWGVLAPVGALVFSGPAAGLRWYVAYLAVFIGSGVAGQIAGPVSTVPEWFTSIMLGLNVAVAGSIVFILLATFLGQRDRAMGENARLFLTVRRQSQELSRFLSPQVAALVTSEEGAKLLEGHRRQISVIFCDLRGFTTFSETVEPEEVLGVLRQHQAAMGELIVKYGGTLEHFAGDGMMVFFNDPVLMEGHERVAVRLAVAMRDRFADLALGWKQRGYALGLGIGVASGYATLGRIGFEGRYDYGAVGNVVILASRLSTEARPGQILVSQRVHAAVETDVETVPLGDLSLKGMTRPVPAFDVVAAR